MKTLRISTLIIFIFTSTVLLFAIEGKSQISVKESGFIRGVDISKLLEIEDHGGIFKENGISKDALHIFKDHGINFVRLKIWHTPVKEYNNLDKVLVMANRLKSLGFKFLLDFHYSDTWADPGKQTLPIAWENLSFEVLKDSVYQYTRDVITALKNQNTLPDMVQIGNEITCGMLWDHGRICGQNNTPQQWTQFSDLIKEGIRGINESIAPADSVRIMIHIDRGGDNSGSREFFDQLLAQNVNFDIIGLSYYPWWHGTLSDLKFNTDDLARRYGEEIVVVETSYPWTLNWNDNTHNRIGLESQLHPGYAATVEGQTNFLSDLINLVRNIPNNKGVGLFYWAPEWITAPQLGASRENVTLFDFTGEVLKSIDVFDPILSEVSASDRESYSYQLYQNYPNLLILKRTFDMNSNEIHT